LEKQDDEIKGLKMMTARLAEPFNAMNEEIGVSNDQKAFPKLPKIAETTKAIEEAAPSKCTPEKSDISEGRR
jgi:hypothetical protein